MFDSNWNVDWPPLKAMCIASSFFFVGNYAPGFFFCKKEQLRENCTVHPHDVILEVLQDHVQRCLDAKLCLLFPVSHCKFEVGLCPSLQGACSEPREDKHKRIYKVYPHLYAHIVARTSRRPHLFRYPHGGDYHFQATSLWSQSPQTSHSK